MEELAKRISALCPPGLINSESFKLRQKHLSYCGLSYKPVWLEQMVQPLQQMKIQTVAAMLAEGGFSDE